MSQNPWWHPSDDDLGWDEPLPVIIRLAPDYSAPEAGRRRTRRNAEFLSGWLARDPARLAASLEQFVSDPAYGLTQLRDDLERFAFLLGGSDGESLFGPLPQ